MICKNCGKEVEDGLFCSECGEKLVPEAEVSAHEVSDKEPAAEVKSPDLPDKKAKRWPIVIPILLLVAFLAALASQGLGAADMIATHFPAERLKTEIFIVTNISRAFTNWSFTLLSLFPLIGAVLFFIRTKKTAPATAVPYLVFGTIGLIVGIKRAVMFIPHVIPMFRTGYRVTTDLVLTVILLFVIFIPFMLSVVYLLGTIIKIRFSLFAVLFLVGAVLLLVLMAVGDVRAIKYCFDRVRSDLLRARITNFAVFKRVFENFLRLYGRDAFGRIFRWFTALFAHIALFIALLSCRKKKSAYN